MMATRGPVTRCQDSEPQRLVIPGPVCVWGGRGAVLASYLFVSIVSEAEVQPPGTHRRRRADTTCEQRARGWHRRVPGPGVGTGLSGSDPDTWSHPPLADGGEEPKGHLSPLASLQTPGGRLVGAAESSSRSQSGFPGTIITMWGQTPSPRTWEKQFPGEEGAAAPADGECRPRPVPLQVRLTEQLTL